MKTLILIALGLILNGCATTHDYCINNLSHYANYNECYQEVSASRKARAYAMSHAFDGMSNQRTVRCTSYNGGDGYIYTNCR